MKNRIVLLILALAMLFSLISCRKKEEKTARNEKLTVETEPVVYTDAGIREVCERFASVLARMAPYMGYPAVNEEKEMEIADAIRADIIPIARDIQIYEDELFALVRGTEECFSAFEEQNNDDFSLGFALDLYTEFSAVIDSDRTGRLIFRVQLKRLNEKLWDAEEKYENNGYGLENVEHYRLLLDRAYNLGEGKFSDAFASMMFMAASSIGIYGTDDGAVSIGSSDALVVVRKQAERLVGLNMTDEEWQTVAAMCEENIPTGKGNDLKAKILLSLNNDNFFVGAATLMPDLIAFYSELTKGADVDIVDFMASDDPLAYECAVYSEMLKNREALSVFLDKISAELPTAGSFSLSGVNAYDKAGYTAFLSEPTADKDALICAIEAFVLSPSDEGSAALRSTWCAFIAGINPVVAYVYFYI